MNDRAMRVARLPVIRFDTADYARDERDDAWREHIAPYFLVEPAVDDQAGLSKCSQHVVNLGEALVGVTAAESQVFARTRLQIASEGVDHFLLQVFIAGGGAMPDRIVEPGDILVIDMGQPHVMQNHDFRHITFVLPRRINPLLDRTLEPLHARTLPQRDPQVRLLGQHMRAIWENVPALAMDDGPAISRGIMGLASHLLGESSERLADGTPDLVRAMKFTIRRYLDDNLSRTITTEEILQRFKLSRATLYRMFSSEGGLHSFIRARRLARAHHMLMTQPETSIGIIGWACGFTGDTQFTRTFRQFYGRSPRAVRAEMWERPDPGLIASGARMRRWLETLSASPRQIG